MRVLAVVVPCFLVATLASARQDDVGVADDLKLAREELDAGHFYKASKVLKAVLDETPDLAAASLLYLESESAQGHYETADEVDAKLAQLAAHTEEIDAARARYAFARGQYDRANSLAESLASSARDRGRVLEADWMRVAILFGRGEREAARTLAKTVLPTKIGKDGDPVELFGAARILRAIGQLELAAECCVYAERTLRSQNRSTADVLLLLGDLERAALSLDSGSDGGAPRAFATYRDALEQNSGLVAAKVGRAWMHLYVNASVEAEAEIDDALLINPRDPDALVVKAWIQVGDARYADALKTLEPALVTNPNHKKAHAVRAAAFHLLRRTDEFATEEKTLLALDPTYGELYWTIGDALSKVYRFEEAVPFHERAVKLDPELPLAPISLGRDLCFSGREAEGQEALEKSEQTHPFAHPWRNNMLLVMKKLRDEFVAVESKDFDIKMNIDENAVLGPLLRDTLESDIVKLETKYGWHIERKVLVEMFPEMADFSVRSVGLVGVGAVGVCFGHLVTLVSPRSEARWTFVWRRTALHELTHVFTLGRSKKRVPRWFTEGLSVYEERCVKTNWYRDQIAELNDAVANHDLLRLRTFNAAFRGPRIGFGYFQAGLVCEFIAKTYGFDKILAMLDAYADDLETPNVIDRVFHKSPEALDDEFEAWVRANILKGVAVQASYGIDERKRMRDRIKKDPNDVETMAQLAWALYQSGNSVDAGTMLDKVLKIDPSNPAALRLLGRRDLENGREDLAREHLERAFATGKYEYYSSLLVARLRNEAKDDKGTEEALRAAHDCFKDDPSDSSASDQLRKFLLERGRDDEARALLLERIELIESAFRPRLDYAEGLFESGDLATAEHYIDEAEDIDPFSRRVYRMRAAVATAGKHPADAITALRRALLVDRRLEQGYSPPRSPEERTKFEAEEKQQQREILIQIVEAELELSDLDAATKDLDRLRQIDPQAGDLKRLAEAIEARREK